jgi:hypothetical protein
MNRYLFTFFIIALNLAGATAQARVFSFSDSSVAAYFRATGGQSQLGQDAFKYSSGASTRFQMKDDPEYNYTGEIGVMILMGDNVSMRLGVEGFQSRQIEAPGFNSGGSRLMSVDSKVSAFIPNLTLEFKMIRTESTKTYLFAGAGYASMKSTNDVTVTATGAGTYGGLGSYKEAVSSTGIMSQAGAGFEFVLVDNATLATEIGYRILSSGKMTHDDAITTPYGAVGSGATATKNGTGSRALDLGGAFVGVSIRFYIPPLR